MGLLSRLVGWWLFERRRPKPAKAPVLRSDRSASALATAAMYQANAADMASTRAFAMGLANAMPNVYAGAARQAFSGHPSMAIYEAPVDAVSAIAQLVPHEWGDPQLIPSYIEGHRPGWQKGVDLGYAARDPQWQGHAKQERAVRAAVEEFVGLCKGHTVAAWRVIEHYDIRMDAYRLRLDAWGPR